jgi:hypothetical protein
VKKISGYKYIQIFQFNEHINGKYTEKHREIMEHKRKESSDSLGPCSYVLNEPFFTSVQRMSQTHKFAKYIHANFNVNMKAPDYSSCL